MTRFLATTAVAALLAGGAFAQAAQDQQPEPPVESQETVATMGQEHVVRAGDTVVLDSMDAELTLRLRSALGAAMPADAAPAADEVQPGGQPGVVATVPGAAPGATAPDGTVAPGMPLAGQELAVSDGDTIVVEGDTDAFQLTFLVRAMDRTAGLDRTDRQARTLDQVRADDLIGSTLYGAGDETIGTVGDVILTQDGQADAILVDVGGFLGIGAREVAIGIDDIEFMIDGQNNWYVYTPYTQEQLEAHPAYDAGTYQDQRDQQRLIVR